jgi:DNA-binding response OmpR family regulator
MENKKKIIVIEDDKDINELISYNLRKEGYAVDQVFNGFDAQEKLAKEVFDVILLDIMLPGIDGFHICKTIKENPIAFKTFVVLLTARVESQDKIYGNLVGADYYITKPFSVGHVLSVVKELILMRDREFIVTAKTR